MDGPGATNDLRIAHVTQAWLAVNDDPLALSTGAYFYDRYLREPNSVTRNEGVLDQLVGASARLSGVSLGDTTRRTSLSSAQMSRTGTSWRVVYS